MKRDPQNNTTGYTIDDMRRYAGTLPSVDDSPILDEQTAQAARSVLRRNDPAWERHIGQQVDSIIKELDECLDQDPETGRYQVDANELRGIVARAVSRGSGQTAVDLGRALSEDSMLAENLETASDDAAAPRLLGLQQEY
jgi:hypothetical protein